MRTITEQTFNDLNISYSFPEPMTVVPGRGGEQLKNRAMLAVLPDHLKSTGLEGLEHENFHQGARRKNVFGHARRSEVLLTTSWSAMLNEEGLTSPEAAPLRKFLTQKLAHKPLIELGAGSKGEEHSRIFRKLFSVRDYIAVDMQSIVEQSGGVQFDALAFLAHYRGAPANIVAFGLFNEPLSPLVQSNPIQFLWPARKPEVATRLQWEQEYLRRLAKEIGRVLPIGGILFGDGIHPLSYNRDFEFYLQGAGLKHDSKGYMSYLNGETRFNARDPFFMVK